MDAETWFFGAKAKEWGLADEVTTAANIQNNFDLSIFRRVPVEVTNQKTPNKPSGAKNAKDAMRDQIIAQLKQHGVEVDNSLTDEQLMAKLGEVLNKAKSACHASRRSLPPANADATIALLNARIQALKAQNAAERTNRLRNEITALANEGRLPLNAVENWLPLERGERDRLMAQLRACPSVLPGGEPVNAVVELTSEDPREIEKGVLNLFGKKIHNAETARKSALNAPRSSPTIWRSAHARAEHEHRQHGPEAHCDSSADDSGIRDQDPAAVRFLNCSATAFALKERTRLPCLTSR
jgi:hypothetical protein